MKRKELEKKIKYIDDVLLINRKNYSELLRNYAIDCYDKNILIEEIQKNVQKYLIIELEEDKKDITNFLFVSPEECINHFQFIKFVDEEYKENYYTVKEEILQNE